MIDASELDRIAVAHLQSAGFTPRLIRCRDNTLRSAVEPGEVVDLGCADGLLTALLCEWNYHVVGVDASPVRIRRAEIQTRTCNNVELRQATFEEFIHSAQATFDTVVLSCVLEHVNDPIQLLKSTRSLLRRSGRVVAIVPNALSLHRRAGALMGIIQNPADSSELDASLGHERSFTRNSLMKTFAAAGLRVVNSGGHMLKPVPNQAMADLSEDLVNAYEELGRRFVALSAELFAVGEWSPSSRAEKRRGPGSRTHQIRRG